MNQDFKQISKDQGFARIEFAMNQDFKQIRKDQGFATKLH